MQHLPTSSQKQIAEEAERKLLDLLLVDPETIRERFGHKPITFLKMISPTLRFPKKLRLIFSYVWLQQGPDGKPASRFIIKGPRGGGKTLMMGAVGFARWFLKLKSIVAMGGSLAQAQNVYNYFVGHCLAHPSILDHLPKDPTMHKTVTDKGNYFKAVPASPKGVRGPHPDDLVIDEACEAKDEIIMSALPMVSSSLDPLVVMTSTFHKIFGYFQEVWDDAEKLGYVRLSWDIFDVCASFDPAIWNDPQYVKEIPDLALLKERAAGRTGDPEGWVQITNIIQAWREKPTLDWFDVEYMGSRPSAAGMVNDPEDVDACVIPELGNRYGYRPGALVIGGVDWGFSGMTSWVPLMAHTDEVKVQIEQRNWSQVALDIIVKQIVDDADKYQIPFIYGDSAGKFENLALQNALNERFKYSTHKCIVVEVVFSQFKFGKEDKRDAHGKIKRGAMSMLGNYRSYFQRRKLRIPKKFTEAIWQHKRYRYAEGTDKPMKQDDHIPDATMLALKHWPLGRTVQPLPKVNTQKEEQRNEKVSTLTGGLLGEIF